MAKIELLLPTPHIEVDPLRLFPDDIPSGDTAGLHIYDRYATSLAERVGGIALPEDDPSHPYFEAKPGVRPSDPAQEKLRSYTFVTRGMSAVALWFTVDHGLVTPSGPRVVLHAEDLPDEDLPEGVAQPATSVSPRYVLSVTSRDALMYAGTHPYLSGMRVVHYANQMVDLMADAHYHHTRTRVSAATVPASA